MNDKAINMTDITEIIFANKNKDYGAYVLRRAYIADMLPGRYRRVACSLFLQRLDPYFINH